MLGYIGQTGKRKFVIALIALFMSFTLALADKIAGGEWVAVTTLVVGIFGMANVGAKIVRNGNGE